MCQISPELVGGLESCLHGYNIGACFGDLAFKVIEELIKLNLNQIELVCKIYVGGGIHFVFSENLVQKCFHQSIPLLSHCRKTINLQNTDIQDFKMKKQNKKNF